MSAADGDRTGRADHWNEVYARATPSLVSWYQKEPSTSLAIIGELGLPQDAVLLDVGGGASTLVDALLLTGYSDISVLDVSGVALAAARARVGETAVVTWLNEDLLAWSPPRTYDLWHDRAVFHFLTEPAQRDLYRAALHAALGSGGHAVIATFAPDGPEFCSGLPVVRHDAGSLGRELGPHFVVEDTRRQEHVTPAGVVQPFTWVVARRRGDHDGPVPSIGDASGGASL